MDLLQPEQLDVFIRGSRDYVQASQVLSRSIELLGRETDVGSPTLISAKFENITKNKILLCFKAEPTLAEQRIGSAVFEVSGERIAVFYYVEPNVTAAIIEDKQDPIIQFKNLSSPMEKPAGVAVFRSSGSVETLLEGTIAVIKRLHQEIDVGVVDVWFTAIARAALTDRISSADFEVDIRVNHFMKRVVGGRIQTLSSVDLSAPQIGTIPTFQVAFSYRNSDAH